MTLQLPYGGREIAELRANKKRPADMVLVSLDGPLRELNPVVVAQPKRSYDWRFLTGLEVMIIASSSTESSLVKRVIDAILLVNPYYLGLWLSDKQNGISIAFGSWRPVSKTFRMIGISERKMLKGLGQ